MFCISKIFSIFFFRRNIGPRLIPLSSSKSISMRWLPLHQMDNWASNNFAGYPMAIPFRHTANRLRLRMGKITPMYPDGIYSNVCSNSINICIIALGSAYYGFCNCDDIPVSYSKTFGFGCFNTQSVTISSRLSPLLIRARRPLTTVPTILSILHSPCC